MAELEFGARRPAGVIGRRSFLRAHWGFILVFASVVTLSAAIFSYLQPSTFTSLARVVVEPQLLPNGGAPPPPDMGTEKAVATSSAVNAAAAERLRLPPQEASAGLSVAVPVDTRVLEFRYTGENPREAARRVAAFSQAYVDYRSFHSTSSRKLVPQVAEIITPASTPTSPSGPNHTVQIGAALILGLALGTGIAAATELWDGRVRGPGHLGDLTGAPVLAVVPRPRLSGPDRLVMTTNPDSATAEAYRFLHMKMLDPLAARPVKTLVVTCAADSEREARNVVSANLAAAVAEAGRSVIIVPDRADRLALEDILGVGHPSLDVTAEVVDLGLAAGARGSTLEAGAPEPRSPERGKDVSPAPLARTQLRQKYDVVIVQAAPIGSSAGTLKRLRQSDACLLVVDSQLSDRTHVKEAHREATHGSFGPVTTVLTYPCSPRRAGLVGYSGGRHLFPRSIKPRSNSRLSSAEEQARSEGLA